ncbi:hypothetical protein TRFO_25764 [Tritrichomonas foetus]|uniref:Eukaryotic translation initiation factor 3 subunit H n=1 Tax=Tritrichomonas foetus TaxID=1144522 RepID=A0A1J4K9U7_9EUKA|nr:hypothetical protein TRFO_25764 [Tritrichomonas foetus]|eukprot:OHT06221.1 hypothetical protein TRFO_25764 [Tritrichomonas foetus]
MYSITLSPVALFQIIKDIKMGPAVDHAHGRLYGMPSDENGKIEVTHAFPNYSKKEYSTRTGDQNISDDYKKNAIDHIKAYKKFNVDKENVGWYTSQSCGRRFDFKDLNEQFNCQNESGASYFCLVVDLSESSLSLRAFGINDQAMAHLNKIKNNYHPYVDESMYFENLLLEYPVSFSLSALDQEITTQILSSFNLIADVFRLRDPSAFEGNVPIVTEAIDDVESNLRSFTNEKRLMKNNRTDRENWLKERRQTNENREKKGLSPLPEDEVNEVYPLRMPSNKNDVISQLYKFNANSAALREELDEEVTKMKALVALGETKQ